MQRKGWTENVSYTLNTIDRPAVSYGFEPGIAKRGNPEGRFSQEKSPTLRSNMGYNQTSVVVLNDQGGRQMEITQDKTATLRVQEHGHQPIIACGFDGNAGAQSGSTGFTVEGGVLSTQGK